MKVYIARQPIYNSDKSLFGYELLHRNSEKNYFSGLDPNQATRELTYNVLSEFDFYSLTNEKYGFINFTKQSLMSELPLLYKPENIIIEILEDVILDKELIDRIIFLKEKKYTFALDDFIDDNTYNEILPYVDIIKVEYSLLSPEIRSRIAKKYKHSKKLVAERIETKQDYKNAISDGYTLHQGYYFSKPIMMSTVRIDIASSTYLRLWKEISKDDPSFNALANIIKLDAGMTFKLLSVINTPVYFRGNKINSVKQALVHLGINETKRWIMLLLIRDISNTDNDEFAKISLIRAMFMEKIIEKISYKGLSQEAYMVGLLSMIDNVLEKDTLSIVDTLELSDNIKRALIEKEGILYELLECIRDYEDSNWDSVDEFNKRHGLHREIIYTIYIESLKYADAIFKIDGIQ